MSPLTTQVVNTITCSLTDTLLNQMAFSRFNYNRIDNQNIEINYNTNQSLINEIINEQTYQQQLNHIASMYKDEKVLEFYIDGSLSNLGKESIKMGLGWIQTNTSAAASFFSASIKNFPSSTKAETYALLTTLLVVAYKGNVTVHTDSQTTINNYNKYILNNEGLTFNKKIKSDHLWIWSIIRHIISTLELQVSLVKVKGHSNNFFNDKADLLAKEGRSKDTISLSIPNTKEIPLHFNYNN